MHKALGEKIPYISSTETCYWYNMSGCASKKGTCFYSRAKLPKLKVEKKKVTSLRVRNGVNKTEYNTH